VTRRAAAWLAVAASATGCVYYNAMWTAERAAGQARRAEERGLEGEARGHWMRAAVKAESVHVRHPDSRWADDAWVLHAEGLVRAGSCAGARATIAVALREVADPPLRERLALIAGECALELGVPEEALRQLAPALASGDRERRAQAEYLMGRAAEARGDRATAIARYEASGNRAAARARVRVLLRMSERVDEGLAGLAAALAGRFDETEWESLLDAAAAAAGSAAASAALDRALDRSRVPGDARARLLVADGDRLFAAGDFAAAAARYRIAERLAAGRPEGDRAQVRRLRATAALADDSTDLARVKEDLDRMRSGRLGPEASSLDALLGRVLAGDHEPVAAFRTAELARDSLRTRALAGRLFLGIAARDPASLFAAKALVAALSLVPEQRDSITAVLESAYAESPYVQAARGYISPGYTALEDSLARALGFTLGAATGLTRGRVAAPRAGPRGPDWEAVFATGSARAAADTTAAQAPGRGPRRPGEPVQRPRPAEGPIRPDL
jgi:tetratricopeptide (TPR) repeat protein